jgi:selenocysteine lyase/cysteine desulfurase
MLSELERAAELVLETYSNVHRGSGQHSAISTELFDKAREAVLEHLGLDGKKHVVVFCTPRRAEWLGARLERDRTHVVSSAELGLPLGVRALAVDRKLLSRVAPPESGGGTARLVGPGWVVWAKSPARFEAGTPAIVNVIACAKLLGVLRHEGVRVLDGPTTDSLTAKEILYEDELEQHVGHQLLGELRRTLIGRGATVPTAQGPRPYVNLDNAASTPTFAPIWEAVRRTWRATERVRHQLVAEVKAICSEALGAPLGDYDVIFTSNATEAINLVAESLGSEAPSQGGPLVINTLLEHNSNELPWRTVPGVSLVRLGVDAEGFIDLGALEAHLSAPGTSGSQDAGRVKLVAVSGASNVLGAFNDLEGISRVVHRHGARLLVDGAQLVAHRQVDLQTCGIDYLAFSAHKVYAPFGTGVLLARKGLLTFSPTEMERIVSSGEENVTGIVALGKSLVLLRRIGWDVIRAEEQALTQHALRALARVPSVEIHGLADPDSPRLAHKGGVIAFTVGSRMASTVATALAEHGGIGTRCGCHCAHLIVKRLAKLPPSLEQFQRLIVTALPRLELPGVVRVSLGLQNTEQDIDVLVDELGQFSDNKTRKAPRRELRAFVAKAVDRVYSTLE